MKKLKNAEPAQKSSITIKKDFIGSIVCGIYTRICLIKDVSLKKINHIFTNNYSREKLFAGVYLEKSNQIVIIIKNTPNCIIYNFNNNTIKNQQLDFIEPKFICCDETDLIYLSNNEKIIQVDSKLNFTKQICITKPENNIIDGIWLDKTENGKKLLYVLFESIVRYSYARTDELHTYDVATGISKITDIVDATNMGFDNQFVYTGGIIERFAIWNTAIQSYREWDSQGIKAHKKPIREYNISNDRPSEKSFSVESVDWFDISDIHVNKNRNILFTYREKKIKAKSGLQCAHNLCVHKRGKCQNESETHHIPIPESSESSKFIFYENKIVIIDKNSLKIFELK